jgi:hypothetical protein
MTGLSLLKLNRLQITANEQIAYDQLFNKGINIIRGENGSGKSTIADFIFYVLGGEAINWKEEASKCDYVFAEIQTSGGLLTLERRVHSTPTETRVFFGSLEESRYSAPERWQIFPRRRSDAKRSFSQLMFSAMGVPEAQGEAGDNITMHQILRLLYSDQQTAVKNLFRDDQFDPKPIRKAVGELICGIVGYDELEMESQLRKLNKIRSDIQAELKALISILPSEDTLSLHNLEEEINKLTNERKTLLGKIEDPQQFMNSLENKEFNKERKIARDTLIKKKQQVTILKNELEKLDFEVQDLIKFQNHLNDNADKIEKDEAFKNTIGSINFEYCPACQKKTASRRGITELSFMQKRNS